jgi:hypothetical protein
MHHRPELFTASGRHIRDGEDTGYGYESYTLHMLPSELTAAVSKPTVCNYMRHATLVLGLHGEPFDMAYFGLVLLMVGDIGIEPVSFSHNEGRMKRILATVSSPRLLGHFLPWTSGEPWKWRELESL